MTVLRVTIGLGAAVYLGLWAIALSGASGLGPFLAIPLVLAVLVAGGNLLSHFMGLPARPTKFRDPKSDDQ